MRSELAPLQVIAGPVALASSSRAFRNGGARREFFFRLSNEANMLRKARRIGGMILVCLGWLLLLTACGRDQYSPPRAGEPLTWGEQHDLGNRRHQQAINDGSSR
jgi:hypothetical protein